MGVSSAVLKFTTDAMSYVPGIGSHSLSVSVFSYFIAYEFFGEESKAVFAATAGMLHDIGFLVPKVSRISYNLDVLYDLNVEDTRLRELHTVVGGYILSNFLGLYEFSDIAFYHHLPASELDILNPSHVFSNIVAAADFLAIHFEASEMPISKDTVKSKLMENSEMFFPEILRATISIVEKDYVWWSLEDPVDFYMRYASPREEGGERTDEDTLLELGYFMAYIVDAKSPFTRKHSERIADISRALGSELGLDGEKQLHLYIAGLFHDIGKIAIDNSILEKPGPLSQKEFWRMRKHVFYTRKLLEHFAREGYEWPEWASQHHERLDGSGYPLRLKECEIPLESRILQIADVFVALTEDRPYRSPMSFNEAISFLSKEVREGKMDPDVLRALERLVRNGYTFPEKTPIGEIIETVDFLIKSYGGIS